MRRLLVSVCLLVLTASAALAETPAERFQTAMEMRRNGQLDAALAQLDSLRLDYPQDVDYVLARAQLLARLQRDDEALDELRLGSQLTPGYEDVWKTRFRLLKRQQGDEYRDELLIVQAESAQRFATASWWQQEVTVSTQQWLSSEWLLSLGGGYAPLSRDLPNWNSQFVGASYRDGHGKRYFARIARDKRAAAADVSVGLGTEFELPDGWVAGADVTTAIDPFYQADLAYSVHATVSLSDGWVGGLRYRRREYTGATISSVIGSVEKYFGEFRVAYRLGQSRLHSASSFANHVATVNWYYTDKNSAGITVSTGKEAEAIGNGRVLETDVSSIALNGRRQLSERCTINWWIGTHDQGQLYRRRFLGMAVSIRL